MLAFYYYFSLVAIRNSIVQSLSEITTFSKNEFLSKIIFFLRNMSIIFSHRYY